MLDNRDIENVQNQENLLKGIVVKRTNMRFFPSDTSFYYEESKEIDELQENALTVNTKVLVLHKSKDNIWSFVIAPNYAGWIKTEHIAYATEEEKLKTIMKQSSPFLLYKPDYAMIYIGKEEPYIIHASFKAKKVIVNHLLETDYLKDIDRIVTIP